MTIITKIINNGVEMTNYKWDEARENIILSAKKIFLTVGYEKTTVRSIAKAIGKEAGLIYYYFKNKEQLFSSVVESFGDEYEACAIECLKEIQGNQLIGLSDFVYETKDDFLSLYETTDKIIKKAFRDEMLLRLKAISKPIIEKLINSDEHTIQTLIQGFVYGIAGTILFEDNVDYTLLLEKLFS